MYDALGLVSVATVGIGLLVGHMFVRRWERRTWHRASIAARSDLASLSFASDVRRTRNWWSEVPGAIAFSPDGRITFSPNRGGPTAWDIRELSDAEVDLFTLRFHARGAANVFEFGKRHRHWYYPRPRATLVRSARWDAVVKASGAHRAHRS